MDVEKIALHELIKLWLAHLKEEWKKGNNRWGNNRWSS